MHRPFGATGTCKRWRPGDQSGLIWDQITVPLVAQRNDVDLLFRPFQQMPSWGGFKKGHGHPWRRAVRPARDPWLAQPSQMDDHGADDAAFVDRVISVSSTMTKDFCRAVGFPEPKVTTIYLDVDESFTKLDKTDAWERTRQLYRMPANFLLFVGHVFPNKNLENPLRGFKLIAGDIPHDLADRRWATLEISLCGPPDLANSSSIAASDHSASCRKPTWLSCTTLRAVSYFLRSTSSFGLAQLEADGVRLPRRRFQDRRLAGDRG